MNELNTDPQGRSRAPNDTSAPGAPGGKQIIVRHRTRTRVRSPPSDRCVGIAVLQHPSPNAPARATRVIFESVVAPQRVTTH